MERLLRAWRLLLVVCSAAVCVGTPLKAFCSPLVSGPAAWVANAPADPPEAAELAGEKAVRFSCKFQDTDAPRASWDCPVAADLTAAWGIEMAFACPDPLPISAITVYFRSGAGWYSCDAFQFIEEDQGAWLRVALPKTAMGPEGNPEGWRAVDRIRVAAWKGLDQDTVFYLRGLRAVMPDGPAVLIREETAFSRAPGERSTVIAYGRRTDAALTSIGLRPRVFSDIDLARRPERMQEAFAEGKPLVILPYNPEMPGPIADSLAGALRKGSANLMAFFVMPEVIQSAAGIEVGGYVREARPGYFDQIRPTIKGLTGLPAATQQHSWNIRTAKPAEGGWVAAEWYDSEAKGTGHSAIVLTDRAAFLTHVLAKGDAAAQRRMLAAMAGQLMPGFQPSAGPEPETPVSFKAEPKAFRGVWAHDPWGVPGTPWDQTLSALQQQGFTDILPNIATAATAYYPSEVLQTWSNGENSLAACLAAAENYGLKCHAWMITWNMANTAPASFVERMNREGRTQVRFDGGRERLWLCPSNPENRKLELRAIEELVGKYAVDGVHLDFIRYPNSDTCFCPGCRAQFEEKLGKPVENWPEGVRNSPELEEKWLAFRRETITSFVAEVSGLTRKVRPGIQVSAAVYPYWPVDRGRLGQDWGLWCEKGYVDFVCPMNYTAYTQRFEALAKAQQQWAGEAGCYPGIGLSTWLDEDNLARFNAQVRAADRAGANGFTLFELRGLPQEVKNTD